MTSAVERKFTLAMDFVHAMAASTIGLVPWWPVLRHFHDFDSTLVLARRAGDTQYFPLIAGLSRLNFGENMVFEQYGRGIASFPFVALLPHALSVRLFGAYGFVIADMLVAVGYLFAGRWVLCEIGLPARWASVVSLILFLVSSSDAVAFLHTPNLSVQLFPSPITTGEETPFRIPRVWVTEVIFLLALAATLRVVVAAESRGRSGRRRDAFFLGVAVAALVQADVYASAALLPAVAVLTAFRFGWDFARAHRSSDVLVRALVLLVTVGICLVPFILQRNGEHPDVPGRFGVAGVPIEKVALTPEETAHLEQSLICAGALLLGLFRKSAGARAHAHSAWLPVFCLFVVAAGSAVARPIFILGTHSLVQDYHFPWQPLRSYGIAATCLVTSICFQVMSRGAAALSTLASLSRKSWAALAVVATLPLTWAALVLALHVGRGEARRPLAHGHSRASFPEYAELGDKYLEDYREVAAELSRRFAKGTGVLATLDHQLMVWWVALRNGMVLNPDPFSTTLEDGEIERRLAALGNILNLNSATFVGLITGNFPESSGNANHNNAVNNLFLSHHKYGGPSDRWNLTIPSTELERFRTLYDERSYAKDYRVDAVVLFCRGRFAGLEPDPSRFTQVFANSTFRLYLTRQKEPETTGQAHR